MILREEYMDRMFKRSVAGAVMPAAMSLQEVVVTNAMKVQQEQLGDLKLYRVPERTTLASRQSKQVRLVDRSAIPVSMIYCVGFSSDNPEPTGPAPRLLRSKNSLANHFGVPLPSGNVAGFLGHHGVR